MLYLQDMINKLQAYWAKQGCAILYPVGTEVGAGTFNPATFLRVLGPDPWAVVYVEPGRRPKDGRYGDNPNRTELHHQLQVVIKPSPDDIQDLYLASLESIGIRLAEHDVKFTEDDWESPTLGATGLGWQVELDGTEITQFTYFQQMGSIELDPIPIEITYGLDRIAMLVQGVDSFFKLRWSENLTYKDLRHEEERQWCVFNFEVADAAMHARLFDDFERQCGELIDRDLVLPAYWFVMKASHAFNILDARGAIGVAQRTGYIARVRAMARSVAKAYLAMLEEKAEGAVASAGGGS